MTIEIFIQGEGIKDIKLVQLPSTATTRELLEEAKKHGFPADAAGQSYIFIEDAEEPVAPNISLKEAPISQHSSVHFHHCRRIKTYVTYNGRTDEHNFSPSTTIRQVKKWAVNAFGLSATDASDHLLEVCNPNLRPDGDVHLGSLTDRTTCSVCFNLVAKSRVEG